MLKPREINKKNYLEYSIMLNLFYVNCNRNIVCQYQPRFIIFENLVSMQKGGGGLIPSSDCLILFLKLIDSADDVDEEVSNHATLSDRSVVQLHIRKPTAYK